MVESSVTLPHLSSPLLSLCQSTATNSFVTEAEIHHISQGNWEYLVEEQKKKDEVVDRKLRQEEEALRRGQEVIHMHSM